MIIVSVPPNGSLPHEKKYSRVWHKVASKSAQIIVKY